MSQSVILAQQLADLDVRMADLKAQRTDLRQQVQDARAALQQGTITAIEAGQSQYALAAVEDAIVNLADQRSTLAALVQQAQADEHDAEVARTYGGFVSVANDAAAAIAALAAEHEAYMAQLADRLWVLVGQRDGAREAAHATLVNEPRAHAIRARVPNDRIVAELPTLTGPFIHSFFDSITPRLMHVFNAEQSARSARAQANRQAAIDAYNARMAAQAEAERQAEADRQERAAQEQAEIDRVATERAQELGFIPRRM